ncbi:MAG: 30S ribosome-binding factor RbfA [Phycisphaerales bacterium]
MSKRTEQVNEMLRRAVQGVLVEGLGDPRLNGCLLTVTQVGVDTDFTLAVIRVSVLPVAKQDLAVHALKAAARHIRHEVSEKVSMHKMPEFQFKLDESTKRQAEVLDALAQARIEREARGVEESAGDGTNTTENRA